MNHQVYFLQDPTITLANAGGKAANLHALLAAGFPVPTGFVVTTAAYEQVVAANRLADPIAGLVSATHPDDPDSYETASQAIRALFDRIELPDDSAAAIRAAYARLEAESAPAVPVAVRSSATAEDLPAASFAGQQETFLNVRGADALLAAVTRCWSSLWTARAIAYRARQGISSDAVALAVVVQCMVPADTAGVLFTVNPVTGARDEMVLNATWGLGEALVSGRVNPDSYVVDKATGALKQVEIGDKAVMTAQDGQGTHEAAVAAELRTRQTLTAEQIAALAEAGRAIETHFGAPQDIEWAIAGDTVYILQSRAVTTLAEAPTAPSTSPSDAPVPGDDAWPPLLTTPAQPFDLWSQADMGERWPEPVTPFTWSTWEPMIQENLRDSMRLANIPYLDQIRWSRRAYGRVYMNEGAMMHLFSHEFGMPEKLIAEGMGSQGDPSRHQTGWRWRVFLPKLPTFLRISAQMNRDIKEFERRFPRIDLWVDEFLRRDLASLSDAELWGEAMTLWRTRVMDNMSLHGAVTSTSINNLSMLEGLVGRWAGDKTLAQTLITGLSGVITADMTTELNALAEQLTALGLDGVVRENPPDAALEQLRTRPDAAPFVQRFDQFLVRHGHRCVTEAEWRHPRWREAPEQVVEALAAYLAVPDRATTAREAEQRRQREAATAELERRLDPVRRRIFLGLLGRVQHLVRMRDNGQYYLVKLALPMRRLFVTLAGRWVARGLLDREDDFFFLVVPEVEAMLALLAQGDAAAAGFDLRSVVAGRRLAFEHWFTVAAPEVLDREGRPVAAAAAPVADADGAHTLRGVAASRGRVTGVARVVTDPRAAHRLCPGEILVTRATDPGWTPVFSVIGGLVLEVGGTLSHGAIVAREYGLPAVVNVPDATRRIRDGQTVTVDGGKGSVNIR